MESIVKKKGSKVKVVKGSMNGKIGTLYKKGKKTAFVQFEDQKEGILEFKLKEICECS